MEILTLIKNKILEHKNIIEQIQVDIDKLKKNLASVKKDASNSQQVMLESTKLLSLKDRMLVHKSAVLTLEDLKNEVINNERRQKN